MWCQQHTKNAQACSSVRIVCTFCSFQLTASQEDFYYYHYYTHAFFFRKRLSTSWIVHGAMDPLRHQLCRVCEEPAAGFHFGAFTCEGCKSFFGRTCNNQSSIQECKNNHLCVIDKKNRTACKACRLRKCLAMGMSKSGSRYGRRSNWFKIHCLMQQQQQGRPGKQGKQKQQQQQQQQVLPPATEQGGSILSPPLASPLPPPPSQPLLPLPGPLPMESLLSSLSPLPSLPVSAATTTTLAHDQASSSLLLATVLSSTGLFSQLVNLAAAAAISNTGHQPLLTLPSRETEQEDDDRLRINEARHGEEDATPSSSSTQGLPIDLTMPRNKKDNNQNVIGEDVKEVEDEGCQQLPPVVAAAEDVLDLSK